MTQPTYKRRWTQKDVQYLCDHYLVDMTPGEVAEQLKRSVQSIHDKAARVGLARTNKRKDPKV